VIAGVPQGLNNLANQTALYQQADPARIGSSAGLLRTCVYVGALISAAANAHFFQHGATTDGLHDMAIFLLVIAGLLVLVTFTQLPEQKGSTRVSHHPRPEDGVGRHRPAERRRRPPR
jgi:uncharacterized membrane protein